MELVELYNKAVKFAGEVKNFSAHIAEATDASLCIIVSENDSVYGGVTSIRISGEDIMTSSSGYNAVMSMIAEGNVTAKKMMTISLADNSIISPCREDIDMLYNLDENNSQCEVAVSSEKSVKACDMTFETEAKEETEPQPEEAPHAPIEEVPSFSEKPVSEDFSFEEKFGFDFDDAPAEAPPAPVQTLADQNTELQQPVPAQDMNLNNNATPYPQQPQGMNPQFVQPDNMNYAQQPQNFAQQPQGYPYVQQNPYQQNYPQQNPYQQPQGYPQGYPYPQQSPNPYIQQTNNAMNPQFVQPDNMQNYSRSQSYQQYGQPMNQGSFPYNAQPYPQNNMNSMHSQPLNSISPHNPAPYTSSRYMNSSSSLPVGSVPLSGEGKSKFRQRFNKFMGEDTYSSSPSSSSSSAESSAPVSKPVEENLSKEELKKLARDKKKMAKVNADFKKRMKDLGY